MLELRLLSENDICIYRDALIKYIRDAIINNFSSENCNEKAENIFKNMRKYIFDSSAIIVGAFINENLIGFLWAYKRDVDHKSRYHIPYLAVDSDYRHCGIGTQLINYLIQIAKENEIQELELMVTSTNTKAMEFYEKQGFSVERVSLCKRL